MMTDDPISIIDAAEQIGVAKLTVFKVLKCLGRETFKQHSSAHNGQAIAYITSDTFATLPSAQAADAGFRASVRPSKVRRSTPIQ